MTLVVALFAWTGMSAMDYETAREHAYYLTDKMAYELNLNDQQYNDAYEINLDYLLSLNTEADLAEARYLAYRNEDLRHILYDWQWTAFAAVDYLFRPVLWLSGGWYFPIFRHYAHGYYFYNRPAIFWDYRGGHGRYYFSTGFYINRRPVWHGGLRGMNTHMVGHPNGARGGRYGQPGGGRGGFRPEVRGGQPGRGYRFDSNRSGSRGGSVRPDAGRGSSNPGGSVRPDAGRSGGNPGGSIRPSTSRSTSPSAGSSSRATVSQPRTPSSSSYGTISSSRSSSPSRSASPSISSSRGGGIGSSRGGGMSGGSRSNGSNRGGRR